MLQLALLRTSYLLQLALLRTRKELALTQINQTTTLLNVSRSTYNRENIPELKSVTPGLLPYHKKYQTKRMSKAMSVACHIQNMRRLVFALDKIVFVQEVAGIMCPNIIW